VAVETNHAFSGWFLSRRTTMGDDERRQYEQKRDDYYPAL
jgi:hypothetical protein